MRKLLDKLLKGDKKEEEQTQKPVEKKRPRSDSKVKKMSPTELKRMEYALKYQDKYQDIDEHIQEKVGDDTTAMMADEKKIILNKMTDLIVEVSNTSMFQDLDLDKDKDITISDDPLLSERLFDGEIPFDSTYLRISLAIPVTIYRGAERLSVNPTQLSSEIVSAIQGASGIKPQIDVSKEHRIKSRRIVDTREELDREAMSVTEWRQKRRQAEKGDPDDVLRTEYYIKSLVLMYVYFPQKFWKDVAFMDDISSLDDIQIGNVGQQKKSTDEIVESDEHVDLKSSKTLDEREMPPIESPLGAPEEHAPSSKTEEFIRIKADQEMPPVESPLGDVEGTETASLTEEIVSVRDDVEMPPVESPLGEHDDQIASSEEESGESIAKLYAASRFSEEGLGHVQPTQDDQDTDVEDIAHLYAASRFGDDMLPPEDDSVEIDTLDADTIFEKGDDIADADEDLTPDPHRRKQKPDDEFEIEETFDVSAAESLAEAEMIRQMEEFGDLDEGLEFLLNDDYDLDDLLEDDFEEIDDLESEYPNLEEPDPETLQRLVAQLKGKNKTTKGSEPDPKTVEIQAVSPTAEAKKTQSTEKSETPSTSRKPPHKLKPPKKLIPIPKEVKEAREKRIAELKKRKKAAQGPKKGGKTKLTPEQRKQFLAWVKQQSEGDQPEDEQKQDQPTKEKKDGE